MIGDWLTTLLFTLKFLLLLLLLALQENSQINTYQLSFRIDEEVEGAKDKYRQLIKC